MPLESPITNLFFNKRLLYLLRFPKGWPFVVPKYFWKKVPEAEESTCYPSIGNCYKYGDDYCFKLVNPIGPTLSAIIKISHNIDSIDTLCKAKTTIYSILNDIHLKERGILASQSLYKPKFNDNEAIELFIDSLTYCSSLYGIEKSEYAINALAFNLKWACYGRVPFRPDDGKIFQTLLTRLELKQVPFNVRG